MKDFVIEHNSIIANYTDLIIHYKIIISNYVIIFSFGNVCVKLEFDFLIESYCASPGNSNSPAYLKMHMGWHLNGF